MPAFDDLPLLPPLRAALAELGFTDPTPIQALALPPLLAGRDVIGRSQTGSGKTAAFGLPLLHGLELDRRAVQAIVLCPTRELATQITADLRALGRRLPGLRVVPVFGGEPGFRQAKALAEGAHVVVGTPGRVLDHLDRDTLDARGVRALVLDEADRMLELGFAGEMNAIGAFIPQPRQTSLFSATWPPGVDALAAAWLRDPVRVEIDDPVVTISSHAWVLPGEDARPAALSRLLRALRPDAALVFCNFKRTCAEAAAALTAEGFDAAALHGDLEQRDREAVLARFRGGAIRVLVATDVAARGLDIDGLDLVINAELPQQAEPWVHRIGRTGRAGRAGEAWTLITGPQRERLRSFAEGSALTVHEAPELPDGPPLRSPWRIIRLGAGRQDKLRRGDVLGALTGDVGLPGAAVGRIDVLDRQAFVAIAAEHANAALRGLERHGVKGRRIRVDPVTGP